MKKTVLRKYARLIARVGANVQKGQPVTIWASVDIYPFATMLAEECYKAGASRVDMEWNWQPVDKLGYRYKSMKTLSTVPEWKIKKLELMTRELPCRIFLESEDPDGLKGVNTKKLQRAAVTYARVKKPYRDAIDGKHQWCIAAVPSEKWAKKVFPGERKSVAVEKLWRAILASVRVAEDNDPAEEWAKHNKTFGEKSEFLNRCNFDTVEYKSSNGTNLRVGLMPEGRWHGGCDKRLDGLVYNPNMPTEEIYTSPMRGKAEGIVYSTKPLVYRGQIIDGFFIEFKNGKAVRWGAEQGEALLGKMLTTDEGASYIGELALIPTRSPINESGILFYSTLFDENASCHIAMGEGFADCIEGHENMSLEDCRKLGLNDSIIHVDFMIGNDDMTITGYKDGKATPIFINGNWA